MSNFLQNSRVGFTEFSFKRIFSKPYCGEPRECKTLAETLKRTKYHSALGEGTCTLPQLLGQRSRCLLKLAFIFSTGKSLLPEKGPGSLSLKLIRRKAIYYIHNLASEAWCEGLTPKQSAGFFSPVEGHRLGMLEVARVEASCRKRSLNQARTLIPITGGESKLILKSETGTYYLSQSPCYPVKVAAPKTTYRK